jgi:hypothetical protein
VTSEAAALIQNSHACIIYAAGGGELLAMTFEAIHPDSSLDAAMLFLVA